MKYLLLFFLFVFIVVTIQYFYEKSKYKELKTKTTSLIDTYDKWLVDSSIQRPSNAVFKNLYKEYSGQDTLVMKHYRDIGVAIEASNVDLVMSFPTKNTQAVSKIYGILENMQEYYIEEYENRKTINYFFNLLFFAPRNFLIFLGVSVNDLVSKLLGLLLWFLSPVLGIFRQQILDWVMSFFSK